MGVSYEGLTVGWPQWYLTMAHFLHGGAVEIFIVPLCLPMVQYDLFYTNGATNARFSANTTSRNIAPLRLFNKHKEGTNNDGELNHIV